MKKLLASAAIAATWALSAISANAHATSIGYANAGPGTVAVWLGTYNHGSSSHHLEGSMNLVGVNGNPFASTTIPFTLAAGVGTSVANWTGLPGYQGPAKPAGLIDGVTHFYGCDSSAALTTTCVGSASSFGQPDHWQGALFAGLNPGDYQFTWVPRVTPSPTAEWSVLNPNLNGIFTITGVIINPGAVPLPAGAPLLIGGLGLLGWMKRRRKAA